MVRTSGSKTVTVYLDDDVKARLGTVAEVIGISRNRLAVNLLIIGLDEAETYRALVKVVVFVRNLRDRLLKPGVGAGGKSVEIWEKAAGSGTMTIYLDDDIPERLQELADVIGIKRNRLAVNLLHVGLEEAERLRAVGLVQVAVFARELRGKIRERLVGEVQQA